MDTAIRELIGYVSCCQLSDQDIELSRAEIGIMIARESSNIFIPIHAHILLLDFAFNRLNLASVYIVYKKEHSTIQSLVKLLSYEVEDEKDGFLTSSLTRDGLLLNKNQIIRTLLAKYFNS
jgi:RimJ/RimL family protein N-acetyltransferase